MVDASETQEDEDDHDDIDEDDFHEAAHHDFSTPAASLIGDHDTMLGARAGHGARLHSATVSCTFACCRLRLRARATPSRERSPRCLRDQHV